MDLLSKRIKSLPISATLSMAAKARELKNNGVTAVGIIDGRKKHSILFEIFSDKGSGTLIRK